MFFFSQTKTTATFLKSVFFIWCVTIRVGLQHEKVCVSEEISSECYMSNIKTIAYFWFNKQHSVQFNMG